MTKLLLRVTIITTLKVATLASIFFINTVTAPVERGDFDECVNHHTAQIFTADSARCAENPYTKEG